MTRQRPRRVENLNQSLKRQVLVTVRRQIHTPDTTNKLPEARVPGRVRPQHKRVHKKADQVLKLAVRPARYRAPNRYVLPAPNPRQQRRKPSLQNHEKARAARTRKVQKTRMKLRINRNLNARTAMARHRRTNPIARKLKLLGQTFQSLPPVRQLSRYHTPRIALLPKRKIDIIVPDDQVQMVVDKIITSARTGEIGDGKIFISNVEKVIKIRTGEIKEK
jgi:nitrogen regulatory protein PII